MAAPGAALRDHLSKLEHDDGYVVVPLTDAPPYIRTAGDFSGDNQLFLTQRAIERGRSGQLGKIRIAHDRPAPPSGIRVFIDALTGEVRLGFRGNGSRVALGACRNFKMAMTAYRDVAATFGDGTSSNGLQIFADDADVAVGGDCMVSSDVLLQAGDQHAIIDLETETMINQRRRAVVLGDHVWLGRRTTVLADSVIGSGAIVGSGAVVAGAVEPYSAVVGNPARMVRRGVTWSRDAARIDDQAAAAAADWRSGSGRG